MAPPTKRPRVETDEEMSDDSSDSEESLPEHSSKFWLEDGNIVLQVEQTLFRVHGSMLARHSEVFKDMFSIPQPSKPQGAMVENCPVIHLSDAAEDVEEILSIFYDNMKAVDRREIPASMAIAMFRLGKKYQIDYLSEEALEAFRKDYPTDLKFWDPVSDTIITGARVALIKLAHELSLRTVLPALYLDFVSMNGLSDIFERLDTDILKTVVTGRDRLILHLQQEKCRYIIQIIQNKPAIFCCDSAECKSRRVNAFEELSLWRLWDGNMPHDLRVWTEAGTKLPRQVCSSCKKQIRIIFDKVREDTWEKLPGFFNLGRWEDLEDDIP
ncbi:hypothetical protein CPB83DRAFT_852555 [Crepidotus variabilis]|uniref:BTB domain-containing protein n=1 Tax=Crepidotus variabilis TaxID=179855 RepID=A0A9P6EHW8_9AGAR|nr:hypothetical protein CPB83DRAFT_852555 [Crepidotus variabilis]